MKTKVLIGIVLLAITAMAQDAKFINALHQVETGGKLGAIKGDAGRALGPLQIHKAYWRDSGVAGRYEDCSDLDYSARVVRAYMARYAAKAVKSNDYQTMARIHNGGPLGAKKPQTLAYWKKVQKNLN